MLLSLVVLALSPRADRCVEILGTGQVLSSSIASFLYVNILNPSARSVRISGVLDRCCASTNHCFSVRLLGGDFGRWKPNTNRSAVFLWPGTHWQSVVASKAVCRISLRIDSHRLVVPMSISYLPSDIATKERRATASSPFQSNFIPFDHRRAHTMCLPAVDQRCREPLADTSVSLFVWTVITCVLGMIYVLVLLISACILNRSR